MLNGKNPTETTAWSYFSSQPPPPQGLEYSSGQSCFLHQSVQSCSDETLTNLITLTTYKKILSPLSIPKTTGSSALGNTNGSRVV